MLFTVYKVTNTVNGKIYIGKHQAKDLNDGYMGSGKNVRRAIAKYGRENFIKEILFVFDNEDEMNAKEAELVTEDFCTRKDTYNLCPGGQGGFGYINSSGISINTFENKEIAKCASDKANNTKRELWKNSPEWAEQYRQKLSTQAKKRVELNGGAFLGKTHTDESKRKIGQASTLNQKGEKNSQYGTTWIWHENYGNKKIKLNLLEQYLADGWIKTYKPGYRVENNHQPVAQRESAGSGT